MAKAATKRIPSNSEFIDELIDLEDKITELSIELKETKTLLGARTLLLSAESRAVFDSNIGEVFENRVPEIFGNHEYVGSKSRVINVNYKMKAGGFSMVEISGHPAHEVLPKVLGEDYKKLFNEEQTLELSEDDKEKAYGYHPELFGVRIKTDVPGSVLKDLKEKYPDHFEVYIKDTEQYIKEVPNAPVRTSVVTGSNFIGKAAKLPEDTLFKLKDLFRKILREAATSAVKIGNKAQA